MCWHESIGLRNKPWRLTREFGCDGNHAAIPDVTLAFTISLYQQAGGSIYSEQTSVLVPVTASNEKQTMKPSVLLFPPSQP